MEVRRSRGIPVSRSYRLIAVAARFRRGFHRYALLLRYLPTAKAIARDTTRCLKRWQH